MDSAFGRWFRELRVRHGLQATVLSLKAGLSRAYVSELESGRARPKLQTLMQLADAMGLTASEREELFRRAMPAESEMSSVIEPLAIAGLSLWRYMPSLIFRKLKRDRNDGRPELDDLDDVVNNAVPSIAILLAFFSTCRPVPELFDEAHLVKAIDDWAARHRANRWRGKRQSITPQDVYLAAGYAYRSWLFSSATRSALAASMLSSWNYFTGAEIDISTSWRDDRPVGWERNELNSQRLRQVCEELICWRVWCRLGLETKYGSLRSGDEFQRIAGHFEFAWMALQSERTWPRLDAEAVGVGFDIRFEDLVWALEFGDLLYFGGLGPRMFDVDFTVFKSRLERLAEMVQERDRSADGATGKHFRGPREPRAR